MAVLKGEIPRIGDARRNFGYLGTKKCEWYPARGRPAKTHDAE